MKLINDLLMGLSFYKWIAIIIAGAFILNFVMSLFFMIWIFCERRKDNRESIERVNIEVIE
jgi:hypothetical protein